MELIFKISSLSIDSDSEFSGTDLVLSILNSEVNFGFKVLECSRRVIFKESMQ